VNLTIDVIALIVMVTIIILLALPASNDFFRREQQVWVPPTDWSQGGGYPQVPPPAIPPGPPAPPTGHSRSPLDLSSLPFGSLRHS
jgi:hypothetical protein